MKIQLCNTIESAEVTIRGVLDDEHSLPPEVKLVVDEKRFSAHFGESCVLSSTTPPLKVTILLGLGKPEEMTLERVRRLMGKCIKITKAQRSVSCLTDVIEIIARRTQFDEQALGSAVAEGLLLADYTFSTYLPAERRQKAPPVETMFMQWTTSSDLFQKGIEMGKVIADATNFVREIVNEPANVVNGHYLERCANNLLSSKVTIRILRTEELEKLGMGALLGVNAGSAIPPRMIVVEYRGKAEDGFDAALVGKGITFDSGGYNLKPTKFIEEMHTDMAGAGAVLGVLRAASELNIPKNIVGILPICENMISGTAQRPGDIVRSYTGKTIQIGNTDAEGRLILADALGYAIDKYHPHVIVDLATLTGACVVALGYYAAGVVGNTEELISQLREAGEQSGDRIWPLPFYEEYHDWMDGSLTDLNNIATKGKGYEAGSITAGVFLSKFVGKTTWAHLDIAGSAYWAVEGDYLQKGATGSGVRVLLYWLMNNEN